MVHKFTLFIRHLPFTVDIYPLPPAVSYIHKSWLKAMNFVETIEKRTDIYIDKIPGSIHCSSTLTIIDPLLSFDTVSDPWLVLLEDIL
jgi:hypothetical protein